MLLLELKFVILINFKILPAPETISSARFIIEPLTCDSGLFNRIFLSVYGAPACVMVGVPVKYLSISCLDTTSTCVLSR